MSDLPTREHRFADLLAPWLYTAACRVPLLLWQDKASEQTPPIPQFHHDFFSLYLVRRGRGTHIIDGVGYAIAKGDVYAMGPGMVHFFADCHDLLTDTLHFAPSVFDTPTRDALGETPGFFDLFVNAPPNETPEPTELTESQTTPVTTRWLRLSPEASDEAAGLVAELKSEWERGTPDATLLVPGLFLRLLVRLSRYRAQASVAYPAIGSHENTVARAVRYIEENCHKPLRVEQIAAHVFLSPHRFTEVFGAAMGRTPSDYVRYVRTERAKQLLTQTNATLDTIAHQTGLTDAAHLSRIFRRVTGQSPGQFRRRH
jgi:AraC-like DNA-binding protein